MPKLRLKPEDNQKRLPTEVRQGEHQVRSGHYIRHDDMKAWLLSWGTEHELPPPKCVCGSTTTEIRDLLTRGVK